LALEKAWHVECFVCSTCGKAFEGSYVPLSGMPYCNEHFAAMAAQRKCAECEKPFEDPSMPLIQVLEKEWHPGCFRCHYCKGVLSEGYFEKGGYPACRTCMDKK